MGRQKSLAFITKVPWAGSKALLECCHILVIPQDAFDKAGLQILAFTSANHFGTVAQVNHFGMLVATTFPYYMRCSGSKDGHVHLLHGALDGEE